MKMVKKISILGSTGSIGKQTIEIVRSLKGEGIYLEIVALSVNNNIAKLEEQIREFRPKMVSVFDTEAADVLRSRIDDLDVEVVAGIEGLCKVASIQVDLMINAVVGMIGLRPTICAIESGNNVALANKETLVSGGQIVIEKSKQYGAKIIPVDSEHSAIFQCLQGCGDKSQLKKIILTASGGPFFKKSREELRNVSKSMALNHPNWSMGHKVTIDSATMMNKGLEIIEAHWLFNVPVESIDVLIHRESIIHSMIEYRDNSIIAQLGVPDMRLPIQYAITYPKRINSPVKELDLSDICNLSFFKPDLENFKCLRLAIESIKEGGLYPTSMNAANEEAVNAFLREEISFLDIADLVEEAMNSCNNKFDCSIEDILEEYRKSRQYVLKRLKRG